MQFLHVCVWNKGLKWIIGVQQRTIQWCWNLIYNTSSDSTCMNKGKKKQQLYYSDILYKYKNRDRLGKKKRFKDWERK